MKNHENIKNISYEEAVEELENIVTKLDKGDLSLNESLELFQKGIALYKHCYNILDNIEGDIKIILEQTDGNIIEKDLEVNI